MKFAVAVTSGTVSGPGEAMEIRVYDTESQSNPVEIYENPALTATTARGISMLKSVIDRGVTRLVISGIGDHAMQYAKGRLELLGAPGMTVDQVLELVDKGELGEITGATHHGSHDHTHH